MKRLRIFSLIILFISTSGCSDKNVMVDPIPVDNEDDFLLQNPAGLNIKIDPRVELLAVVQHFTSWAGTRHAKFDFEYKHDIDSYFSKYSEHAAIKYSQLLTNNGFTYDAPVALVLYHSDPPEFTQKIPYSNDLITRAGSEANLKKFAENLRAFAVESDFMKFYVGKKKFYNHIQNAFIKTIGDTNYIKLLEDYYGDKKHSYNILPSPLFHPGGYGPQVQYSNLTDIYNVCGPYSYSRGELFFGDKNYVLAILLHEFSHSFVNPITEKNLSLINNSSALLTPIQTQMQQQAYSQWHTCVNEHLVRAVVARIALILKGPAYKDLMITSEVNKGFIYIPQIDSLLDKYEKNRDQYPTFESFYPRIIELLNSLL